MTDVTSEKIISDLKVVVADAEEILKATAGQAGEKMADLRAKLQDHLINDRPHVRFTAAAECLDHRR